MGACAHLLHVCSKLQATYYTCGTLVCVGMNAIYYTHVVNCFLVSVWGQYWARVACTSYGLCTLYDCKEQAYGDGTVALYAPYRTHS